MTFTDHGELYWLRVSAVEPDPATLEEAVVWVDPSTDPATIRRWSGADWEDISSGGGGGVTDHGALTGLADDDHTQYTTTAEATIISGDAVDDHEAETNPHPDYTTTAELAAALGAYQVTSAKGAAGGYASLDSGILVPVAQLATGTPDGTKFLRDDRVWAVPVKSADVLETLTPTGATATFGLSVAISQAYRQLKIRVKAKMNGGSAGVQLFYVRFNNDSGSKYRHQNTYYSGSTIPSSISGLVAQGACCWVPDAVATNANAFGNTEILIPFYAGTNNRKHAYGMGTAEFATGSAANLVMLGGFVWEDVSAITRIDMFSESSTNFLTGTILELVGER